MTGRLLLTCLLLAPCALPQSKNPTGSLEGVILDPQGKPRAGVDVRLTRGNAEATTGPAGEFTLPNLAPGPNELSIGFRPSSGVAFCQRAVTILPGQVTKVRFSLAASATLSGRVVDEYDEPAPHLDLGLYLSEYASGALRTFRRYGARTDDEGNYRFDGVSPDLPYQLLVLPHEYARLSIALSDAPTDPRLRRPAPVPTYYPGATDPAGAELITLHSGEHRDGVNLRVRRAPSYCVEGQVPPAASANSIVEVYESHINFGISIHLGSTSLPRQGKIAPGGGFRFCDLHPGEYHLRAVQGDPNKPTAVAIHTFSVRDRDALDVLLHPAPRFSIPVEISWASGLPPKEPIAQKVRLGLRSLTRSFAAFYNTERIDLPVAGATTGMIDGFLGDEYHHSLFGFSGRVYVKEVVYGNDTITHTALRPASTATPIRITLGHDGALLKVRVVTREKQPVSNASVILIPAGYLSEAELGTVLLLGLTDGDGNYTAPSAIAPGRYRLVVHNEPLMQPLSPPQVQQFAGLKGREVNAEPGADLNLELGPVE